MVSPVQAKDAALGEVKALKQRHADTFARSVELRKAAVNKACRTCKADLRQQRQDALDEAQQIRRLMHDATRRAYTDGATWAEMAAALGCSLSTLGLILHPK
jgi:hypothetical protein